MPETKKKANRGRGKTKTTARGAAAASTSVRKTSIRRTIDPGWTWDDRLPLAQARQVGDTIYVSGQIAYDPNGNLVGQGDMKAQTRQALDNIKSVLERAGSGMKDVVKINTYITDRSKFMDMIAVRSEVFGDDPPASTAVVVQALAFPELLVEIEAIAIKRA